MLRSTLLIVIIVIIVAAVRLRDQLRGDDAARRLYETRKRVLINARRNDPAGYTAVIGELGRQTLQTK